MLGLTTIELIGYSGAIIGFGWGVWQHSSKLKLEKQKLKYITYNKISENINFFSKGVETIRYEFEVEELKSLEDEFKNFKIKLSTSVNILSEIEQTTTEVKNKHKEIKDMLNSIQDMEKKSKNFPIESLQHFLIDLDLNEKKLVESQNVLTCSKNDATIMTGQMDLQNEKFESIFKTANQKKVYDLLKSIKNFLLSFNDISDLQIISSIKVIKQVSVVKEKAETLQWKLNSSILDSENFPRLFEVLDFPEMKQQSTENEKLLFLMRDEIK